MSFPLKLPPQDLRAMQCERCQAAIFIPCEDQSFPDLFVIYCKVEVKKTAKNFAEHLDTWATKVKL